MSNFINKQTTLDLNGPILSFITQPISTSSCTNGTVSFVGIATAVFPNETFSIPTGYISYKWYLDGYGELNDGILNGMTVVGSATTTLTLSSIPDPVFYNNSKFFLRADYIPTAYSVSGTDVTVGTARSTGNAINDPKDSDIAILSVYPNILVTKNPGISTVARGFDATFSVEASTTNPSSNEVSYQWQLNEIDLVDGLLKDFQFLPLSSNPILTVIDSNNVTSTVDFTSLSSYSNFIPGKEYTLTTNKDIEVKITASGAGGGRSIERDVIGGSGGLSQGNFKFVSGQIYKLRVGGAGVTGGDGGYGGGGNGGGGHGKGGGGGGFTGLFLSSVSQSNAIIIAGGGGGGSNDPSSGGAGGGLFGSDSGNVGSRGGYGGTQAAGGLGGTGAFSGTALQGGSGAAGGGGGYYGGGGGLSYSSCCADGAGGGGSGYLHPTLVINGLSNTGAGANSGENGSFKIDFLSVLTPVTGNFEVSGSQTSTLTINSSVISSFSIRCKVTHPTACNSPTYSTSTNFNVVSPESRAIISIEEYQPNSTQATIKDIDIINSEYLINSNNINSDTICFYAKERDITLEMDMYSSKGRDYESAYFGGEGGFSKIKFLMKKNDEYILKGVKSNTAIYLYRKAQLIACVGEGGSAGYSGNGGRGGGVGVSGENGFGANSGVGGQAITSGQLSGNGVFGSSSSVSKIYSEDSKATGSNGGRTISCTKGVYWRQQGKTACEDLGTIRFRLSDGVEISNSALINRGFKDGYSINQTSGLRSVQTGGNGGNGATGGGGGGTGGGGGGSGYTDTSIFVVQTTLGGNKSSQSSITMRLSEPIQDYYIDSAGRILILSAATPGKDPRTLTKTTGRVLPGTDTCIDDARWQNFLELAKTQDYRLVATVDGGKTSVTKATTFNIRRMINANNITLKNSLTGWEDTNYSYTLLALSWDETNANSGRGFGSDYSILSWSPLSAYGFGYYGLSSNPFFASTVYNNFTANWWILPPGIPDFP